MPVAVVQPAAPATGNPFFWGDNGAQLTPAQIAARAQIANSLIANRAAPQNVGEGLNSIGNALLAKAMMGRADAAEQTGLQSANYAMAAAQTDPNALIPAVENQFLTPGQQAVATAMLNQRMMQTNPDMIAQRGYLTSETALDNAKAAEMTGGGPNTGNPIQGSDGNYYAMSQYGTGLRQLSPGTSAPQAGGDPSAPAVPVTAAPLASGAPGTPASAVASTTPVPLAPFPAAGAPAAMPGASSSPFLFPGPTPSAPPAPSDAPAISANPPIVGNRVAQLNAAFPPMPGSPIPSPVTPTGAFLSPAQQAAAKAAGTEQGKYTGDLTQNQQKAASALEEQDIVNQSLLGAPDPKTGQVQPGLIDQAIALAKNPLATGIPGQLSEGISGTPAANLNALLENIEANANQKAIQDFRDSAPVGGTGMRISQREALIFGKTLSNISAHQGSAQLVQQLTTLKSQLQGISGGMRDSYERMFGSLPAVKSSRPWAFPQGYALPMDDGDGSATVSQDGPPPVPSSSEPGTVYARNPQTGARLMLQGTQWVPAP